MSMAERNRHLQHAKKRHNNKRAVRDKHGEKEARKETSKYRDR